MSLKLSFPQFPVFTRTSLSGNLSPIDSVGGVSPIEIFGDDRLWKGMWKGMGSIIEK